MSCDDVNKQLRLIGIKIKDVEDSAFHEIGSSIPTRTKYKNAINNLYHRRNAIAHQSDRSHKTGVISMNQIRNYTCFL